VSLFPLSELFTKIVLASLHASTEPVVAVSHDGIATKITMTWSIARHIGIGEEFLVVCSGNGVALAKTVV
jgi:phosphoribosylaminoimidazole (AIR) synthetase